MGPDIEKTQSPLIGAGSLDWGCETFRKSPSHYGEAALAGLKTFNEYTF